MQRKILVSPRKGVGCRFQKTIDHGNKSIIFKISSNWYMVGISNVESH
jgi:hypothetical protein